MNETDLLQKLQKLRADGSLTDEERAELEKAVRAKKQAFWLRIGAVLLGFNGFVVGNQMTRSSTALPPGFNQIQSQGMVWEYRWVSPPPIAPARFFTGDGVWEYRPHKQQGPGVPSNDFESAMPAKRSLPALPPKAARPGPAGGGARGPGDYRDE